MTTVSRYYLSPTGRAAIELAVQRMKSRLAQRRADRELTADLGPRRDEQPQPIPVGDATDSDFGAFSTLQGAQQP